MIRIGFGGFIVAVMLVAAGCGGGGSSSSAPPTTKPNPTGLPTGWKRCTNTHLGFSLGYPASWYVASHNRLRFGVGVSAAYRRHFYQHAACLNYDPKPFTVVDGSEYPTTAIVAQRLAGAREVRTMLRWVTDLPQNRTIARQTVTVGGHPAVRFDAHPHDVLYPHSRVYGYVINFGAQGGVLIEAWWYGFKPVSSQQYRSYKALADQMAPTARVSAVST